MTHFAGRRYPFVIRASPVGQPPSVRHSASSSGPAARWIAPSTPPPPSKLELAALTMASTARRVMSARAASSRARIFAVMLDPSSDLDLDPKPVQQPAHSAIIVPELLESLEFGGVRKDVPVRRDLRL